MNEGNPESSSQNQAKTHRDPGTSGDEARRLAHEWEATFDAAGDGIFLLDTDQRILRCNRAALTVCGKTRDEVIGRHCWEVVHGTDRPIDFCPALRMRTSLQRESLEMTLHGRVYRVTVDPLRGPSGKLEAMVHVLHDITDLKRTQEALHASEVRLGQAIRVAGLGTFEHDHGTDIIQWSPEMRAMCGFGPDERFSLQDWIACVHPDDRERIATAIRKAHDPAGEGLYAVEHRIVRRDGAVRWVSVRARTFFEGEGSDRRPVRTIGAVADITEQKQAEETLRESQARYRAIFEQAADAIVVFDPQTLAILDFNDEACRRLGYTRDEFANLKISDFDVIESAEETKRRCQQIIATGLAVFETRQRTKTGAVLDVEIRARAIELGGKTGIQGVWRDITERKRTEEALRNSEEKYRQLVETTDTGYVIVDQDGAVLDANPEYLRLTGRQRLDEVIGRRVLEWTASHDRQRNAEAVQRCVEQGFVRNLEIDYVTPAGRIMPVEINASVLPGTDSFQILALCRDIMERKAVEEALRKTSERLSMAQQAGHVGVFDWDMVSNEVVWTQEQEDLFGLPRGTFENRYEGWSKWVHPEDLPRLEKHFADWLQSDRDEEQWEYRYLRQGETRWISARARVFRDSDGKPIRMVGTNLDITERKAAQEELELRVQERTADLKRVADALRESREKYRVLAEGTNDVVYSLDVGGFLTYISPQIGRYGIDPEKSLGRNILDLIHPEDREAIVRDFERTITTGEEFPSVFRIFDAAGKEVWVEDQGKVQRDAHGNIIGISGVLRDISERRQTEAEMMRLASFPLLSPNPITEVDRDGQVRFMNPTATRLFPDLASRGVEHPWLADWNSTLAACTSAEANPSTREVLVNGRWYHQTGYYVAATGQIRIYGLDITKRKLAEEALARRSQQLRALAAELTLTEERERKRLAAVLHDHLQQLLVGAKMSLSVIGRQVQKSQVKEILSQTEETLAECVELSRSLTVELSPSILYQAGLPAALGCLAEQVKQKFSLRIELDVQEQADPGTEDLRILIYQALRELLFNIAKHARTDRARVSLKRTSDGSIDVEVADQGAGFDPAAQQNAKSPKGFGLFEIRERVELLGGEFSLESAPGRGTRVKFRLPPSPLQQ